MTPQYSEIPALSMTNLLATFGPNLEFGKNLASLTSYRTGGKARYFLSATSADEVARGIQAARRLGIPSYVIGGGSNLLVSDAGYDGLIIKVDVSGMRLADPTTIECGAGEDLMALVDFATQNELAGLEFAAGIWGSVGGAIYGNAGAYGGEIGTILRSAIVVSPEGVVKEVGRDYCRFAYRDSYLKVTHEVVVTASFGLSKGDKIAIESRVKEVLASREQKHPNELTAGCFFKNIPDPKEPHGKLPAGRLLEQVGVKELSVGGAKVYEKHANIIVNTGSATSQDIRKLADIMKQRVKDRFGIELQEEVQQLGTF